MKPMAFAQARDLFPVIHLSGTPSLTVTVRRAFASMNFATNERGHAQMRVFASAYSR